jgi:exopolysaccharide biosynthesis polyprenyl glycosylphosphotransferase
LIHDFVRIAPDTVLVALRWNERNRVADVCKRLRQLPVDVWVLPELSADAAFAGIPRRVGSRIALEVSSRPLRGWKGITKRAEDLFISAFLIVFTGPIMLAIAAAIRLSGPGPVLIRQRRHGFANKPFMVLKFRTMYSESGDLTGARATVRGDPRVTRIGRALRAISLDELPQLFNVLRGEMSVVGPRPHPIEMRVGNLYYEEAVKSYSARHRMKPGITGLAQINGCRGLVDTLAKAQRRLDYDLHYIENWSFALDLRILCATIAKGFINESAY